MSNINIENTVRTASDSELKILSVRVRHELIYRVGTHVINQAGDRASHGNISIIGRCIAELEHMLNSNRSTWTLNKIEVMEAKIIELAVYAGIDDNIDFG